MPPQLRNGTFGTSSAECDVIRAKFFRFFREFLVKIARSFQEAQKKGGSFLDSEFLIEIRQSDKQSNNFNLQFSRLIICEY